MSASAISTCFLWLITYSSIGWGIESAVCSLYENKPVNRGFLKGPVCPVYGFGALTSIIFLYQKTDHILLIFIAGTVLDCTVEYFTGALLEKLFHLKWWDYSDHRFQLRGRICLSNGLAFGFLSVLLVKYIHPVVAMWTYSVPEQVQILAALVILAVIEVDLYATLRRLLPPDNRLEEIAARLTPYAALAGLCKGGSFFGSAGYGDGPFGSLLHFGRSRTKRMLSVFPKLKSINYSKAWQKLKIILRGSGKD
ncbi:conserved membrane protein of unknown function [Ruminococcaceae bacterium BL-6]|nr:conserved membrane protein of unknown function [Ruminococcaceae bacterium BL-6]